MRAAVIGGGIQGVSLALELAARGVRVELLERSDQLMQGASRHNEGKVHLGFVYANEPTFATARLMSRGAFAFSAALRRWLEQDLSKYAISRPFVYAVHRDSLVDPDTLTARYKTIGQVILEEARSAGNDYFGVRDVQKMRRLEESELQQQFDSDTVAVAFESSEIAVDPNIVADLLVARVRAEPRIRITTGTQVVSARKIRQGVTLSLQSTPNALDRSEETYDQVFNCAWCGRLKIDATLGIKPDRPWSFRRKHFLRVPAAAVSRTLESTTIVLGAFGDVVQYASGDLFLSWYPVSCDGIETGLEPRPASNGSERGEMKSAIVLKLSEIVPALAPIASEVAALPALRSGVIYALGATDINHQRSPLHARHDVGARSFGSYHSVDTGKYTLAPLFAQEVAERVIAVRKAA